LRCTFLITTLTIIMHIHVNLSFTQTQYDLFSFSCERYNLYEFIYQFHFVSRFCFTHYFIETLMKLPIIKLPVIAQGLIQYFCHTNISDILPMQYQSVRQILQNMLRFPARQISPSKWRVDID